MPGPPRGYFDLVPAPGAATAVLGAHVTRAALAGAPVLYRVTGMGGLTVYGQIKNRPVVLLRRLPPFGDFLVCGISTQLHQRVAGFDEEIAAGDPEFAAAGLKAASLIRLGFLAVVPDSALLGTIGSLSSTRHLRLLANLCRHLGSQEQLGMKK